MELMIEVDDSRTLLRNRGVGLTQPKDLRPFVATPSKISATCLLPERPAPGWKIEFLEGVGSEDCLDGGSQ